MTNQANESTPDKIEKNETAALAMAPELVALDRLCLSGLNVRRTERDADIASLAEDIAANGLKQNLVVTPAHDSTAEAGDDWAYKLEVIAGGRRYQALQLLVSDGRLPADTPVPCLIEGRDNARQTSLSENLHRVAMNPADEFDAYAAIVDQHLAQGAESAEAAKLCARRFGKSVSHVEGRLRLASLAPEILQALRENAITLDAAKAYASVSDQKLQLKVFKAQAKARNGQDPRVIRDAVRGKTLPIGDARVNWVGLIAYRAAGGRTETEMFMGSKGEERVLDVALLEKLAAEKAEPLLAARAKKDGFKDGVFAKGVGYNYRAPKCPAGFKSGGYWLGYNPTKAQLKKSIAIYAINQEGADLVKMGRFMPKDEKGPAGSSYSPKTPEELAAERRTAAIGRIAAHLAVGKFAGTPLEGRAFWPTRHWVDPLEEINEEEMLVAVLIKVTKADIEAQREAAAEKYDAELAEAEAEKLRLAQETAQEEGVEAEDVLSEMDEDEDQAAA